MSDRLLSQSRVDRLRELTDELSQENKRRWFRSASRIQEKTNALTRELIAALREAEDKYERTRP